MRREVETKERTHQKVWEGDGVVGVFYEPLGRDGRVAPHLPTDKQADSSDQLQLCPAMSHPISHYEGRARVITLFV